MTTGRINQIAVHFGRSMRPEGTGRSRTSEGYFSSVVSRSLLLFPYRPSHPPGQPAAGKTSIFATSSDSLGWEELAIHTSATRAMHSGRAALTNLGRSLELRYLVSQLACPSGRSRHNTQFKSHHTWTRYCQALTTITQKRDKYCTHSCCDAGLT